MPSTRQPAGLFVSFTSLVLMPFITVAALASEVTMQTPFGPVEIELFEQATPKTVANFLNYVNDGSYENSFIHRSVPGSIVQGGGYFYDPPGYDVIAAEEPIENEAGISNTRGTIAMAKQAGDPDSATTQWFFNLEDNDNLDESNGGYTVFGQVKGSGMDVIDEIADLTVWDAGGPMGELPLINYPGSGWPTEDNLVMIDIKETSGFSINQGLNDAWVFRETDGQGFFIIVYPEIQYLFMSWFTFDTERPDGTVTANLGDPGHRWLTAQGNYSGSSAILDVNITSGGVFNSPSPVSSTTKDGTITLEFTGCNSGTISYDIPSISRQDVLPIERAFADNENMAWCQAMAAPAAR